MQPGTDTFFSKRTGRYLSCSGRKLVLSHNPFPWVLKESGRNGFYVNAQNTKLLLDIDNAWVASGNTVKVWEYTGYPVQLWTIAANENGTCSFLHSADPRFCLGFDGENAVLQLRSRQNPMQQWKPVCIRASMPEKYRSFFGKRRTVELRLPPDITRIISATRLQRWADQLETAYGAFAELTGFLPFPSVTLEGYLPAEYPDYAGWVVPNCSTIHIDRDFLCRDLAKMNVRRADWNFCALHEMGHMFDFGRPWNFEAELMADLKLAYVMEKTNAAAAPAEFDASACFYGSDIAKAYAILGTDFSRDYNVFGCTKRFLDIKEQIGWEPFRNTFHSLQKNSAAYSGASNREKFLLFIRVLSRYSGQDIKTFFTPDEWNAILRQVGTSA